MPESISSTRSHDTRVSELVRFVVEHGALAPSGGNCQPWKFYADDSFLWVTHDRERAANLLNNDARGSYLALGAAIENICLAAEHRGHATAVEWFPRAAAPDIVARLSFERCYSSGAPDSTGRFAAIRHRVTNRQRGTGRPLDVAHAAVLTASMDGLDVHLHLTTDPDARSRIGAIVGECDRLRFLCPPLQQEMMREVRWTDGEAERSRNGLALDTLGLTSAQSSIFRLLARPDVPAVLRELDAGRGLTELSRDVLSSSGAVGLIATDQQLPIDVLHAGRAFERLWLDATARGIALQPLGAVTALFGMLNTDARSVWGAAEQAQLRSLEQAFYGNFPGVGSGSGLMLFRLSDAPPPPARSLRFRLDDVLFAGSPGESAR